MNILQKCKTLFCSLWQRPAMKQEIDEELRFHMEMRVAENIAAGMSPEEAAQAARKRFGNVQSVREECRDVRGASFGETTWRDVKFGFRMLRKNRGFTAVALLTLAIGIGANTAIFSLLNAIVIKPLAFRDSERLVSVSYQYPKLFKESQINGISPQGYFAGPSQVKSLEGVAATRPWTGNLTGDSVPETLSGMKATANFFSVLGVAPVIGRTFTDAEEQPGTDRVVMLGHRFWQRRFGGDPKILGRTLRLDEQSYEVIGVLPPTLKFQNHLDIWIPLSVSGEKVIQNEVLMAVGRIKPGATLQQVQSELDALAKPMRAEDSFRIRFGWYMLAKPLKEVFVHDIRPILFVLMGAVVLVLLIACVNIASLQLVRGIGRQKEIAIRLALGASRFSLIRQLLTENLLLALLGGAGGLLLGYGSLQAMTALLPTPVVDIAIGTGGIPLDGKVLLFAVAASIVCGLIFGLAPALQALRLPVNPVLKEAGSGAPSGAGQQRLRAFLAGTQVALALILLTGAGLLLRSFVQLSRVDAGFNPEKLLSLRVSLPLAKYDGQEKSNRFFRELFERTGSLPGAKSAALVSTLPLGGFVTSSFHVDGYTDGGHAAHSAITPGYFQTMQIRLLQGRDFTFSDTIHSSPVAIIDEKLARHYWPNQDPIGKRVALPFDSISNQLVWREIVGVVSQVRGFGLDAEPKEQVHYPLLQHWGNEEAVLHLLSQNLIVRTDHDPNGLVESVRKTVLAIDPHQPITDVKTMDARLDDSLAGHRIPMLLVTIFAAVALALAIIGLYGVMAYTTRQRTREFAIRLALGAERSHLIGLVLRQAMIVVGLGIIVGLLGAIALSRLLNSLLVGVTTTDPVTFVGVSLLLAAVALLACYLPARRAAKVDPMTALRCE